MAYTVEIYNKIHKIEVMNMCRDFSIQETFTDVQLIAQGGRKVFAHKLVLVSFSRLLKMILSNIPDTHDMATIHLPDVTYRTLRLVINFLYIGSMRLNTTEKADFKAALNLLDIDIEMEGMANPSAETNQTKPMVISSDPVPAQQTNMADLQSGPIIVNSFSQNPLALVSMMNNGMQSNCQQMSIATSNDTSAAQQNIEMTNIASATNCQPQANNPVANCLQPTQQLVQVLPIAFSNQFQQFATNSANFMSTNSGGLVAVANLTQCTGSQLDGGGTLQLATIGLQQLNQNDAAAGGLRLMTSPTRMVTTTTTTSIPDRSGGGGGAVIDLSTDDDSQQPPPPTTAPTSATAPASATSPSSPNIGRQRKRHADPEAAAHLAKRLQDASEQVRAASSSNNIIDLDND